MAGHIKRLGPNTWGLTVELPKGPDGRRNQKCKSFHGTIKQARAQLAKLQVQYASGNHDAATMSLGWLFEEWLRVYARPKLAQKTLDTYEEFIRNHLAPALGHYTLAKLKPVHIQGYYNQALKSGRMDGRGGLSPQTVLHHHRLLREVLQQAVKWEYLIRNPADLVDPPQVDRRIRPKTARDDQVDRLLEEVRGTPLYIAVILGLSTGMRRGEVLALQWRDVDLQAGTLDVRRSLSQTSAGLVFKTPKTSGSERTIRLPDALLPELRAHRAEQARRKLLLGADYQDHDLVVCWEDGRPMRPDYLSKKFSHISRSAEAGITFHGVRHTHGTQLAEEGENPKAISKRLGHANVRITLDIYTHPTERMDESAARKINGRLRGLLNRAEHGAIDASESA